MPMHFLCQLDLSQLPLISSVPEMPDRGTLFFFYDTIFAPTFNLSEGGSRVIYVEEDVSQCSPRPMPPVPPLDDTYSMSWWYADNPTQGYKKWNLKFGFFEEFQSSKYNIAGFLRAYFNKKI